MAHSTIGSPCAVAASSRLHKLHSKHGAKFTLFNGWRMPAYYDGRGAVKEHLHVRHKAGLFDISHMTPVRVSGPASKAFLERVTVADVRSLAPMTSCPTFLPREDGSVQDTTLLANEGGDRFLLTTHAGRHESTTQLLQAHARKHFQQGDVAVMPLLGGALLDLQGPCAAAALHSACDDGTAPGSGGNHRVEDVRALPWLGSAWVRISGQECRVTRCGFTGEDGFQILCAGVKNGEYPAPSESALEGVARALLESLSGNEVIFAGLGARDSLRLEAGFPLLGHDVTDRTTVSEAGLLLLVAAQRRLAGGFLGAASILPQLADSFEPRRRRVGMADRGNAGSGGGQRCPPARRDCAVHDPQTGDLVGVVTSGGMSPSLRRPICMGYVDRAHAAEGTELDVVIRGARRAFVVVPLPFLPAGRSLPE